MNYRISVFFLGFSQTDIIQVKSDSFHSHIAHIAAQTKMYIADSRFVPSQWETSLQSNGVSHWLGANLESALMHACTPTCKQDAFACLMISNVSMYPGFYTKGRPLVKSNLICPSDKLSWWPDCPVLNNNIQGNFCISQGNGSFNNLPENLV